MSKRRCWDNTVTYDAEIPFDDLRVSFDGEPRMSQPMWGACKPAPPPAADDVVLGAKIALDDDGDYVHYTSPTDVVVGEVAYDDDGDLSVRLRDV